MAAVEAATFQYTVRDRTGKLVSGSLTADSQTAVVNRLKSMGYAPLSITKKKTGGVNTEINIPGFGKKKVKLKDLAIFSRQFATMLDSGLSLIRALSILVDQTDSKELAKIIKVMRTDIEGGQSLSESMVKHETTFPPLMVNMVKAGEVGGFLDSVLKQVAANFEADVRLRGKIKAAMTYPVIVFIMAMIGVTIMLVFIVPIFVTLFAGLGGTLPLPTRILVFFSHAMKILAPIGIVLGFVFITVWPRVKRRTDVRSVVDPAKLKMPVFGNLVHKLALARFCRNLGTMMQSGVPILQSLDIVAATTGNIVLERATRDVQESVRQGESMARPLQNHAVFPPMVVQMMAVGEETGALDSMLHKIADFYQEEVEALTEALTSLIEPLMIGFLGSIIGAMIIALYMPIFKLMDLVK